MTAPSRAERIYRLLLRCYPGEFRDEYEREMLIAFRERMAHEGRSGMLALWMQVLADAVFRAPAEHLDVLSQDLRYARRSLRRAPVFAAMAILTLALGIGANTAIFSVVHAVALRPLPFADSDRLLRLWEKNDELGIPRFSVSALNYLSWREQARTLDLAGWRGGSVTLTGTGDPIRVSSAELSPSLLPLIGVRPKLGRLFDTGEDRPGGPRVAILSEALWRRHFGSNPAVVGSTVAVSGTPFTIVGLIPTDSFPTAAEFFMPLAINVANESRGNKVMSVIGRLKPSLTHDQAQQEMDSIASRLAAEFPDSNKGWGVTSATVYDWLISIEVRNGLYLVLAAVGCVLLIACANVANLMLARATGRRREMALRIAIGAARRRLVRQVLTEGLVLAVLGGGAGILFAVWGVPILQRQLPSTLPRADAAAVNGTVLAFSVAVTLLTGVLFGALPATTASRRDVVDSLKEAARGSSGGSRWARQVLVVAQVALATILLVAAGLLVRSLQRLQLVDLGFQPASITTAMMGIPQSRYANHQQQWSFYQRLMARLSASPGVQSVGLSSGAPFVGGNTAMPVTAEGASRLGTTPLQTDWRMVSPNYFSTLGIPLLRGRSFRDSDVEGTPQAMVVSEGMARRIWGDDDPIGRRIIPGPNQPFTVVGIVGDVRNLDLSLDPNPTMYVSTTQSLWPTMTIIVRGLNDAAAAAPLMRQAVKELDPQLALFNVRSMDLLLGQSAAQPRVTAWLVGLFAIVALALSAVGIYGVLAYLVSQRTQEIGIRMALGARPGSVLGLFLSRGMRLVGAGLAVGLVGAVLVARTMDSLLFGVQPFDLPTFVGATVALAVIALIASYVPARRATRVDPLIALRAE